MGSYYIKVCESIIQVKTKTPVFWGESNPYPVSPKFYSHLLSVFFQDTEEGGGENDQPLNNITEYVVDFAEEGGCMWRYLL